MTIKLYNDVKRPFIMNSWFITSVLFLIFIQVFCTFVYANTLDYRYQKAFKVQRLSLAEGLSQSVVNDVIQDRDGYIWVATEDGLNRFDSYKFKVFHHDHRNENSLHENNVISLLEEPGVGIWVGTAAGLSFYNPIDQSFTNYSEINKELKTWIRNFHYSQNKTVWIATDNGLFYFDRKKNKVKSYISANNKNISTQVSSITESEEFIYVATSNCLYQISKNTNELSNLCEKGVLKELINLELNTLKSQGDFLWVGSNAGLYRYNILTDVTKIYLNDENNDNTISDNYIQDLSLDSNGSLWIATTKGLNFYNTDYESFEHFGEQNHTNEGLSSSDVISLFIDNQNLLWLGTYGGGVNVLDPNQHQFEHILNKTEVLDMGNNNVIQGIEKDRYGSLWLASYGGGLIKYNLMTGAISRPFNKIKFENDNYIWSLLIDRYNHLWVASREEINIIDIEKNSLFNIQFFIDEKKSSNIPHVNTIYEDRMGVIWIVSELGLFKVTSLHKEDNIIKINLVNLTSELPASFINYETTISTLIQDKDGNFWFGGEAGLLYYKVEQNEWSHFSYDQKNIQSLSNDNVQVIFEDSQEFLWVGTADGLNRIVRSNVDKNSFYFERITTYEGLPNNSIYGILEDKQQQLWISTNQGLVKYASTSSNIDVFKSIDGLSSDEFNPGAHYSDNDGRLYFGSINGITIVNDLPKKLENNNKNIIFTKAKVGSRELDVYLLNHSNNPSITQHSDEPAISISVANLNYSKLGTQRYRYRLVNINEQWEYLGVNKEIFIAGLVEGEHLLEIQSQLSGESWFGQNHNLRIVVETRFWNSRQGYFLIGVLLLLLFSYVLFLLAHFYKNKIEKTKRKINIEVLRIRELRSDNDYLKRELDSKETEVLSLNKKIRDIEKKIGIEKYRDATTGFYTLNYLFNIDTRNVNDNQKIMNFYGFDCYKSMAIFELDDYFEIQDKIGPIAAAELASQVSILMRQKMDAGTEMFCIQKGLFLILNRGSKHEDFEKNILNLRHQVIRSEYNVANGLSSNTSVSLTIFNFSILETKTKSRFIAKVNLLINCHKNIPKKYLGKSVRLNLNHNNKGLGEENYDRELIDLLDNNILNIEEII